MSGRDDGVKRATWRATALSEDSVGARGRRNGALCRKVDQAFLSGVSHNVDAGFQTHFVTYTRMTSLYGTVRGSQTFGDFRVLAAGSNQRDDLAFPFCGSRWLDRRFVVYVCLLRRPIAALGPEGTRLVHRMCQIFDVAALGEVDTRSKTHC